jgi:phosphoadenosine phosphosulfate reductase
VPQTGPSIYAWQKNILPRKLENILRQLAFPEFEVSAFTEEAVAFIREHEPPEGYFVGFSGGKDSIVTQHLVKMAGVKFQAFHSLTSIDPPEVVKFIRKEYPEVQILKPKMSVYEGIIKKKPPLRMQRWCCDVLKKSASQDHPLKHRLMGIRAEESARRASRPRVDNYKGKWTIYKPIFRWPEWAVWEFIHTHKLKYPSLYDEGFHRLGCVVCPFILGKSHGAVRKREQSMQRWPGIWRAYKNACHVWFEKKRQNGEGYTVSFDDYWQAYLNGFE